MYDSVISDEIWLLKCSKSLCYRIEENIKLHKWPSKDDTSGTENEDVKDKQK